MTKQVNRKALAYILLALIGIHTQSAGEAWRDNYDSQVVRKQGVGEVCGCECGCACERVRVCVALCCVRTYVRAWYHCMQTSIMAYPFYPHTHAK